MDTRVKAHKIHTIKQDLQLQGTVAGVPHSPDMCSYQGRYPLAHGHASNPENKNK